MASLYFDKHYKGQGPSWNKGKVDKIISLRLSQDELDILHQLYPGKSVSYAIRSLIHAAES